MSGGKDLCVDGARCRPVRVDVPLGSIGILASDAPSRGLARAVRRSQRAGARTAGIGAALGMGVGCRARSFDWDATLLKRTPSLPT